MKHLPKIFVGLSLLAFVLAVVAALGPGNIMNYPPESFSRACTNLALLGIAAATICPYRQAEKAGE